MKNIVSQGWVLSIIMKKLLSLFFSQLRIINNLIPLRSSKIIPRCEREVYEVAERLISQEVLTIKRLLINTAEVLSNTFTYRLPSVIVVAKEGFGLSGKEREKVVVEADWKNTY